jgi:DNA modification methylase
LSEKLNPELQKIYTGDCIEVMKTWPDNFIDTIITDPPYGLDFMGKDWDGDVPGVHFWEEMLRICKPGATLLSFGGTRTWHHLAMAIEKAGWQIRDSLMWLYGSGFPKSLNFKEGEFKGWGTALKPAWEPIIVAMKPIDGTFAENAENWGVAGINVDGGRIVPEGPRPKRIKIGGDSNGIYGDGLNNSRAVEDTTQGRWPANLLLDEEAAAMLDGQSGNLTSGELIGKHQGSNANCFGKYGFVDKDFRANSGGASRFFYVAKSASSERNEGCDLLPRRSRQQDGDPAKWDLSQGKVREKFTTEPQGNHHPTVKPLSLMKYLCNLTRTPTGGIVLDPFAGSGTTLWAAEYHNRPWIGIEMNPEYVAIAEARLALERSQMKLAI